MLGLERDATGPDVRDASLDQIEGDGEWSGVVFWHALEHLPAPGEAIREAARLLNPGGVILVAVPNSRSLQARPSATAGFTSTCHATSSTSRSGRCASGLERSGFRVERVSQVAGRRS